MSVRLSYKNLYESKVTVTNFLDKSAFFDDENDRALKDYERNACEGKLNENEALDALKTMEPEKTPGTDGLPAAESFGETYLLL